MGLARLTRWALRLGLAAVAVTGIYLGVTFFQVWSAGRDDQTAAADVAVVLGAAQYDGRPSPVLQARLDHALALFEDQTVAAVIVTGGKQEGDRFTEAFSSYDYLRHEGIPEEALFLEVDGTNTYEQLSAARLIMTGEGFESALLVSSPYHSKRLLDITGEVGMPGAAVSPTDEEFGLAELVRETGAVALGRVVGYRRLGQWV